MSDLGQDRESLALKVLEVQHSIAQKEVAKLGIELELGRIRAKISRYEKSTIEINEQIEVHNKDLESLKQALDREDQDG